MKGEGEGLFFCLRTAGKELYHAERCAPGPLHCSSLYPVELLAAWINPDLVSFMLLALESRRVLWPEHGQKLKEPPTEDTMDIVSERRQVSDGVMWPRVLKQGHLL